MFCLFVCVFFVLFFACFVVVALSLFDFVCSFVTCVQRPDIDMISRPYFVHSFLSTCYFSGVDAILREL